MDGKVGCQAVKDLPRREYSYGDEQKYQRCKQRSEGPAEDGNDIVPVIRPGGIAGKAIWRFYASLHVPYPSMAIRRRESRGRNCKSTDAARAMHNGIETQWKGGVGACQISRRSGWAAAGKVTEVLLPSGAGWGSSAERYE
jgi:hypothetical protein